MEARSPRAYSRGMEQNSIQDSELLYPSWVRLRDSFKGKKIVDLLGPERLGPKGWFKGWGRYGGVDLSNEHRPGNIIVSLAGEKTRETGKGRRYCPLEVHGSGLKLTHPQVLDHMTGAHRRWDWDSCFVESNAQQEQVLRVAERLRELGQDVPWLRVVHGFCTTAKKWDEHLGLPALEAEFAQGAWLVPYGEWEGHTEDCPCGWCQLDRQLSTFTREGPGTEFYDELMAVYFAWEAARAGSHAVTFASVQTRG